MCWLHTPSVYDFRSRLVMHGPIADAVPSINEFEMYPVGPRYPFVDFVLRGDSTEEPCRQLLAALRKCRPLGEVENLTWKDAQGQVRVNPLSFIPADLDYVDLPSYVTGETDQRHQDHPRFLRRATVHGPRPEGRRPGAGPAVLRAAGR